MTVNTQISAAGIAAASGRVDPWGALAACLVGALVGDCIMYAIGYHFGSKDELIVALHAGRVGTTSITWELDIYRESDDALIATGRFVHVFLDGMTRRPIAIPETIRDAVERTLMETIDE